jgi:hypothetical protein
MWNEICLLTDFVCNIYNVIGDLFYKPYIFV